MATTDKSVKIEDAALAEFVRRLVEIYHPLCIYLFGSRARGDWGPDSDYDLMIVVPDETPRERRDGALAWDAMWATEVWSEVVVVTAEYFESRRGAKGTLPATVVEEGQVLYDAR